MGLDDDGDCAHPDWVLQQLHLTLDHAGQAYECAAGCGAVRYDEGQEATRPALERPRV